MSKAKEASVDTEDKLEMLGSESQQPLVEVTGTAGFVYMSNTDKVLSIALATGENVILYGPGGFGKSEYTEAFLRERDIEPFVITMGSGMTTDRLFGGIDIKKFENHGQLEYLVENSFMNHEFVIFEELFDAPDFILEQLKDILSSGIFRNGTQTFRIKTRNIFCCTNKTRADFAKDASLKALMERFPLEHEVNWKSFDDTAYAKLLQTKFGVVDEFLCYLFSEYANEKVYISPRIAVKTAKIVAATGYDAIPFIADFAQNVTIYQKSQKSFQSNIKLIEFQKEMKELEKQIVKNIKENDTTSAIDSLGKLVKINDELKKLSFTDAMIKKVDGIKKDIMTKMGEYKKQIDLLKSMTA
jgi:hypothetical protein